MSRPPKPISVIKNEKKAHRTKKEIKLREQEEKSLQSGVMLFERSEVKNNIIAHEEFVRISALLKNIEKDDSLYASVINRYCQLFAECRDLENKREEMYELIFQLKQSFNELKDDIVAEERAKVLRDFARSMAELAGAMISLDNQVMSKRRMLFDIEKENVMTIAAALRSIPKTPDKEKKNPLLEALGG